MAFWLEILIGLGLILIIGIVILYDWINTGFDKETREILADKDLMRQIKQSEKDIKHGRTIPHEQVFKELMKED